MLEIRILAPVWGSEYLEIFLDVNWRSLAENIGRFPSNCKVTLCIYCDKKNQSEFETRLNKTEIANLKINFNLFESFGINSNVLPGQKSGAKYGLLSAIQKHFFDVSPLNAVLIFNYADFFWSKNSLRDCILEICNKEASAVFSFCPPIRRTSLLRHLSSIDPATDFDSVTSYISMNFEDLLHEEVWRREITKKQIYVMPSYLVWRKVGSGIVFHAYHQTILALKKTKLMSDLGLNLGTLDGYSTGEFFKVLKRNKQKISFLNDFSANFVVSLHPDKYSSETKKNMIFSKNSTYDYFEEMFSITISEPQMEMALEPYIWTSPEAQDNTWVNDFVSVREIIRLNKRYGYLISNQKTNHTKIKDLNGFRIKYLKFIFREIYSAVRLLKKQLGL